MKFTSLRIRIPVIQTDIWSLPIHPPFLLYLHLPWGEARRPLIPSPILIPFVLSFIASEIMLYSDSNISSSLKTVTFYFNLMPLSFSSKNSDMSLWCLAKGKNWEISCFLSSKMWHLITEGALFRNLSFSPQQHCFLQGACRWWPLAPCQFHYIIPSYKKFL